MNIVFMGTPDFAVPSLDILIENGYKPILVVTRPDKPRSRGRKVESTPVKKKALAYGIPVLEPESVKSPEFAEQLSRYSIDVMVVVAYRILPPEVYEQATLGAFNLHASLLPAYRGAAPIHRAVMDGVTETGVTTFFLKQKVDTGDMILQYQIPVGPDETTGELHDRLSVAGAGAVLETVKLIESGNVPTIPQDGSLASPAPKVFREDCRVPWNEAAPHVHNHIRGLSPVPCAWTSFEGSILKVYRSKIADGSGEAGSVSMRDGRLIVACGEGSVELLEVQAEGRKRMSASDFVRGAPEIHRFDVD